MTPRLRPFERDAILFLLRHLVVGLVAALAFAALILALDVGGLRRLLVADGDGWLYLALLLFGLAITFGSLAMGVSVMTLGQERD